MNLPSDPSPGEIVVLHNSAARRFETTVDGVLSVAEYEIRGANVVFTHTLVPSALRGRGIAEKLVRAGLAWAQVEGRRVVPACSYVAVFIERHPEFHGLRADGHVAN